MHWTGAPASFLPRDCVVDRPRTVIHPFADPPAGRVTRVSEREPGTVGVVTPAPSIVDLRQCVLAVSVLDDVDLIPGDEGVQLLGTPALEVAWWEVRRALAGTDPASTAGHRRLARWLRLRRQVADRPLLELAELARPVGRPVECERHPGLDWVRHRVLGGALDLGVGFLGLDGARPEDVVVVPQGLLAAAGIDAAPWWAPAQDYLERMGELAVARWRRDPSAVVRPMGDCDVVTLLGSVTFRKAITAGPAGGMRPAAVPMRTRGWLDLTKIDPAFALAAAAATDPEERGFARGLLITADEVVMVPPGGRPHEIALRDPAARRELHRRPVLYR